MQFILAVAFGSAIRKVTTGGKQCFTFVSLVGKDHFLVVIIVSFKNVYFDH